MIGVIGPRDSTDLAASVAAQEGLRASVMVRAYDAIGEAPALALELDPVCQVLLFTGRVPYVLARRENSLQSLLQFIPHSGADLYRTLVQLLRESRGDLPRISLDTVEAIVVEEAYDDLGLLAPRYVLSDANEIRSSEEIVDFHLARYRAGDVQACVTCVGSVYKELVCAGAPAWRIAHTKSVLREALRQAHLAARLAITEGAQPAAVMIKLPPTGSTADGAAAQEMERRRLQRDDMMEFADHLQGRVVELDQELVVVYTSKSAIDRSVSRLLALRRGSADIPPYLFPDVRVGIGLGSTVAEAEDNARRSLVMGTPNANVHFTFPDGEVLGAGPNETGVTYRLRQTDQRTLRLARGIGLGPLSLSRLTRALQTVDPSAFTAVELARAYGIQARSARRLITLLERAGVATRLGRQGGPRAGRPQTVYSLDLDRLIQSERDP